MSRENERSIGSRRKVVPVGFLCRCRATVDVWFLEAVLVLHRESPCLTNEGKAALAMLVCRTKTPSLEAETQLVAVPVTHLPNMGFQPMPTDTNSHLETLLHLCSLGKQVAPMAQTPV